MRRAAQIVLPLMIVAVLAVVVFGQSDEDYYSFSLDKEIPTSIAANTEISLKFSAVADDAFSYESYYDSEWRTASRDSLKQFAGSTTRENWIVNTTIWAREDSRRDHKDLQLAFQHDKIRFVIDNGQGRYAGIFDDLKSEFSEVKDDGSTVPTVTIPGWVGVTSSDVKRARQDQSGNSAAAWLSIDETGRLHDALYYADYSSANQASYPGRLLDPVDLMRCIFPQWNADQKLKPGQEIVAVRQFPISGIHGGSVSYRFTYKLGRLFGTTEEGNTEVTAAEFSFTAEPVVVGNVQDIHGLRVEYDSPKIEHGYLLFDLKKGVPAKVSWDYTMTGKAHDVDGKKALGSTFDATVKFSASLKITSDEDK